MTDSISLTDDIIDKKIELNPIKVIAITATETFKNNLINAVCDNDQLMIIPISHKEFSEDALTGAGLVVFECRVVNMKNDLAGIENIKQIRPLLPIMAASVNTDTDFMGLAYRTGIVEFIGIDVNPTILAGKLKALGGLVRLANLAEMKNLEAIDTARTLREKYTEIQGEKTGRIFAEAERDMAEEVTRLLEQNKEILDNLQEGFFVILQDMTIDVTTSRACEKLFDNTIAGQKLGEALNLVRDRERLLKIGLEQVFTNVLPLDVAIDLLPHVVNTKNDKTISLEYEVVLVEEVTKKVIVIASDITERAKEQEVAKRRDRKNVCLIKILKNFESFKGFIADFEGDTKKIRKSSDLNEVKRLFHTLKGNSASFSLDGIARSIHEIETSIGELKAIDRMTFEKVAQQADQEMRVFLDENYDVLKLRYLTQYEKNYTVSGSMLAELKSIADTSEPKVSSQIRNLVRSIKSVDFEQLVKLWKSNVEQLAEKLNKNISLKYEGINIDEFDFNKFSPLLRTLVHPFSNACDHGIELPGDRSQNGKSPTGTLALTIDEQQEMTKIVIADDGRGIDLEQLVAKSIEKKIVTPDELTRMSLQEKYHLMFRDGVSTKEDISEVSGRGIGLAALKDEVGILGGSIIVVSKLGEGTTISITVPKK